jgi:hypothetical protein
MGIGYNPRTITSGLQTFLDPGNRKSYPNLSLGSRDHGISDWYCTITTTVTYSAIYPGTIIYENNAGTITAIVSKTTTPTRGTFTATAGRRYFANKSIHLLAYDRGDAVVPISLAGNYFGTYSNRYGASNFTIYAPTNAATVTVYNNVVGGVTGTATTTISVPAGGQNTYSSATESAAIIFSSDQPVVITVYETDGGDKMVLTPASTAVYRRRDVGFNFTINNTTPSTVSTYYVSDALRVFTVEIADGSGGDSTQGLGLENLSDTYSWGDVLSDFQLVAPYPNTVIKVSYWNGTNWIVGETFNFNGTLTSPANAFRDGTLGFGVAGSNISGTATNLASGATLWKWEGNNPFLIVINNNADDEETLYGWMSANASKNCILDLSGNVNDGVFFNGVSFSTDNGGIILFDGVDDYVATSYVPTNTAGSINVWFRLNAHKDYNTIFDNAVGANDWEFWVYSTGVARFRSASDNTDYILDSDVLSINTWYNFVITWNLTEAKMYKNGALFAQDTTAGTKVTPSLLYLGGGNAGNTKLNGRIGLFSAYNRVLSATEVSQNFDAIRGRYGI